MRIAPEPVYHMKPLSWWLPIGSSHRLTDDQLRSWGPGAVDWRAYQVAKSRRTDLKDARSDTPLSQRARLWAYQKLDLDPMTEADSIHFGAVLALKQLGPDAARAVPALLKAVRDGDY